METFSSEIVELNSVALRVATATPCNSSTNSPCTFQIRFVIARTLLVPRNPRAIHCIVNYTYDAEYLDYAQRVICMYYTVRYQVV